jgi:hypothetical protein
MDVKCGCNLHTRGREEWVQFACAWVLNLAKYFDKKKARAHDQTPGRSQWLCANMVTEDVDRSCMTLCDGGRQRPPFKSSGHQTPTHGCNWSTKHTVTAASIRGCNYWSQLTTVAAAQAHTWLSLKTQRSCSCSCYTWLQLINQTQHSFSSCHNWLQLINQTVAMDQPNTCSCSITKHKVGSYGVAAPDQPNTQLQLLMPYGCSGTQTRNCRYFTHTHTHSGSLTKHTVAAAFYFVVKLIQFLIEQCQWFFDLGWSARTLEGVQSWSAYWCCTPSTQSPFSVL